MWSTLVKCKAQLVTSKSLISVLQSVSNVIALANTNASTNSRVIVSSRELAVILFLTPRLHMQMFSINAAQGMDEQVRDQIYGIKYAMRQLN